MSVDSGNRPAWARELVAKYQAGIAHAFVLHFNVRDYVDPGVTLTPYLSSVFANTEVIAYYNRASGLAFLTRQMRAKFDAIVGLGGGQQDEALAALRAVQSDKQAEQALPTSPGQVLPLLDTLLRSPSEQNGSARRQAVVVIDYAETVCPAADKAAMSPGDRDALVTLLRWGSDAQIAATSNVLILLVNNLTELAPDLRAASAGYEAILVPPPTYDERLAYIEHLAETHPDTPIVDNRINQLAGLTAGLGRRHIEDIWLRADAADERGVTLAFVKERKGDIIASEYADVLEPFDPAFGWEAIGGLEHVKRFFQKNVIEPMRAGNRQRVPMGVLLTGPAGTGKTAVAEAVAKEAGLTAVKLKPDKIIGRYLGETEGKLEKALRGIETMAPCLVFIDEIDQKLRRGEGGEGGAASQALNNVFGRLLEFMSDTTHRGKVIFLAATNRPDNLDAAIKRPGRFDKKVPFLMPDRRDRLSIVSAMIGKYRLPFQTTSAESTPVQAILDETDGWSGAELEGLVLKAWELAQDAEAERLDFGHILDARRRLSPSTADVAYMTAIAIKECNDLDLLPEGYRDMLKDRKALDSTIEMLAPAGRTKRQL